MDNLAFAWGGHPAVTKSTDARGRVMKFRFLIGFLFLFVIYWCSIPTDFYIPYFELINKEVIDNQKLFREKLSH